MPNYSRHCVQQQVNSLFSPQPSSDYQMRPIALEWVSLRCCNLPEHVDINRIIDAHHLSPRNGELHSHVLQHGIRKADDLVSPWVKIAIQPRPESRVWRMLLDKSAWS